MNYIGDGCCDNQDLEYQCYSLYQCNNCGAVFSPRNHKGSIKPEVAL